MIADNDARITTLENSGGGSGLFYPSDLYGYSWDVTFREDPFGPGSGAMPDLVYPITFYLDGNGFIELKYNAFAWDPSNLMDPLPETYNITSTGEIDLKSFNFTSDGVLRYLGWQYSSDSRLVLGGAMVATKDFITGTYASRNTGFGPGSAAQNEGTFVATRLP